MTEHRYAELWRAHLHGPPADVWTPQRVALLDSWTLMSQLMGLGITPDSFLSETGVQHRRSAWQFAEEKWVPWVRSREPRDLDFVRLGACRMWKTSFPDHPSQEMLHDHLAAGSLALHLNDHDEAFVHYWGLWRLAKRGLRSNMRQTADANELMLPGDDFTTFTLDFAATAVEATQSGGTREAEPIEELLTQFSGEAPAWRATMMSELARIHVNCGRPEEGERVLSNALAQFPDRGAPYLAVIDIMKFGKHEVPEKLRATLQLLDRALDTLPTEEVRLYDLRDFTAELRRECRLKVVKG